MGRTARVGVALGLVAAALGGLSSCGDDPVFPFDDAACESAVRGPDAVDAFDWLKDPYGGEKRLLDWSTDQGLAFAYQLQSLGAADVTAVGVHPGPGPEPAREALGLVARLPDAAARRLRLFELHARQVRAAGYRPRPDTGQKFLFFCWKSGGTKRSARSSGPPRAPG